MYDYAALMVLRRGCADLESLVRVAALSLAHGLVVSISISQKVLGALVVVRVVSWKVVAPDRASQIVGSHLSHR